MKKKIKNMFVKVSHVRIYKEVDVRFLSCDSRKLTLKRFAGYKYDRDHNFQELKEFVEMFDREGMHIKLDAIESFYFSKNFEVWAIVLNGQDYLIDKGEEEKFLQWAGIRVE